MRRLFLRIVPKNPATRGNGLSSTKLERSRHRGGKLARYRMQVEAMRCASVAGMAAALFLAPITTYAGGEFYGRTADTASIRSCDGTLVEQLHEGGNIHGLTHRDMCAAPSEKPVKKGLCSFVLNQMVGQDACRLADACQA